MVKLANKVIRKVPLNNFIDVNEVTNNPFYNFEQYLTSLEGIGSGSFLGQLTVLSKKLSYKFSGGMVE